MTETSGKFDCHTAQKLIGRTGIDHVRKLKSRCLTVSKGFASLDAALITTFPPIFSHTLFEFSVQSVDPAFQSYPML